MSSDTNIYIDDVAPMHLYFSKEGTMRIGLSSTGYSAVDTPDGWEAQFISWGQELSILGVFPTRDEAEAFCRTTFNLKG